MKAGPIRLNASEGGTPKPGLHRLKDYQWSEVSEEVNIGDNGFRDPSFWESTERGPRISEDRPYEPVEPQEVIVGFKKASISGLDLETSRRTAKKKPYIPAEPRNIEKTGDIYRNPKYYNAPLQLANL